MKTKAFIVLCVMFTLALLVSSTAQDQPSQDENNEKHHVTAKDGYGSGGGGWGGYGGGGWGGPGGGGGWGGYSGGWGGPGGGGWGGPGGGGGWGGPGGGGGGWGGRGGWGGGCRFGCCGWYRRGGCRWCCRSLTDAITFNENEANP